MELGARLAILSILNISRETLIKGCGVIYEVTLEVKRTGNIASLGCDRCVGLTDKREQPAPPLLVRFFQIRTAVISECHHLFVHSFDRAVGYMKPDRLISGSSSGNGWSCH